MKRAISTLVFITALVLNVMSQSATVTVFSQEGEKFWVVLNGIKQNDSPMTNVKVTGLTSPNYRLKIIFEDEKNNSIDKDIMTHDVDNVLCDQAYVIKKDKKGKYVMRLNSFEPAKNIAATVEPNQVAVPYTNVERTAAPPAQTNQQKQPVQPQTSGNVKPVPSKENAGMNVQVKDPVTGENVSMNMNISETGIGVDVKAPGNENVSMNMGVNGTNPKPGSMTTTTTTTTVTTNVTTGSQSEKPDNRQPSQSNTQPVTPVQPTQPAYKLPGYNGPTGCALPMSDADFKDALKSITSKTFEDSKLAIAKQVTSVNCLLASQVKEIMMLFSFEDSKLQFAKYAYTYTYDIGNFFKVNDAFNFEMSIDELNEYISKLKK